MKYYVVESLECYYVESESNYSGGHIAIATCTTKEDAQLISKALMQYERNLQAQENHSPIR